MFRLLDNDKIAIHIDPADERIDWGRIFPFIFLHLACFGVFWVGISPSAVLVALFLYVLRIFSIGAFYHRYFSHKTYQTHRITQFIFALLGALAIQRGPLWWAAHHRHHHATTDTPDDPHSPRQHGFLKSHMGWFLSKKYFLWDKSRVQDWYKYPELRYLDRFDSLVSLGLAISLYGLGAFLNRFWPSLHTDGAQMLIWGFFISTVCVFHVTVSINSLAHTIGRQRFKTNDDSRNHFLLALLTFGEGWHNNHHRYPVSARQGFYWWEIDLTYYGLKLMEKLGIIWELKPVPTSILLEGKTHERMDDKR